MTISVPVTLFPEYLHSKVRRVATESNLNGFISATVFSRVLFLNLRASPREVQRFLEMVRNNSFSNSAC